MCFQKREVVCRVATELVIDKIPTRVPAIGYHLSTGHYWRAMFPLLGDECWGGKEEGFEVSRKRRREIGRIAPGGGGGLYIVFFTMHAISSNLWWGGVPIFLLLRACIALALALAVVCCLGTLYPPSSYAYSSSSSSLSFCGPCYV